MKHLLYNIYIVSAQVEVVRKQSRRSCRRLGRRLQRFSRSRRPHHITSRRRWERHARITPSRLLLQRMEGHSLKDLCLKLQKVKDNYDRFIHTNILNHVLLEGVLTDADGEKERENAN